MAVLAVDRLLWLWVSRQASQRLPRSHVRTLRVAGQAPFPPAAMCWLRTRRHWLILGYAEDEQTGPGLRHPEVRGMKHLGVAVVPGVVDLLPQPLEGWAARPVVVGERVDVLQHEP